MKPLLYWNTLRHLRWSQLSGRVIRPLRRLNLTAPEGLEPVPSLARDLGITPWRACALEPGNAGGSEGGSAESNAFTFLNERFALPPAGGWNQAALPKLWLYNLHYFDWINAVPPAGDAEVLSLRAVRWMRRWIAENPAPFGNGWEPYPCSLRIVNWIKWWHARPRADRALLTDINRSLATQAHVLSQSLETHLLGNHLFENAKALVFAGTHFSGEAAARWFERGAAILDEEIAEQILPDGGYFELSPMYHAIILEGVLDLVALQRGMPHLPWARHGLASARLMRVAQRMLGWLDGLSHPDGGIGFFNDAAMGVAPPVAVLADYASRLGVDHAPKAGETPRRRLRHFEDSGYVRVDRHDMVALLDVGCIGPDYLPGHAHADTLSFEWSLGGERVVVNSGTSVYAAGAERMRQRGTAAHNTVLVDGADSSEVWGQFRVARRAYPLDVRVASDVEPWSVSASHDGYRRLPGRVKHRRQWRFGPRRFGIRDLLSGRYQVAEARVHLHPDIRMLRSEPNGLRLALGSGRVVTLQVSAGELRVEPSTYHPAFGVSVANLCVVVAARNDRIDMTFSY